MLLGVLIVSYRGLGGTPFTKEQLRGGILYGFLGAAIWGIVQVLMQVGIQQYSNALVASFLTYAASLVGMVPALFFVSRYSGDTDPFRMGGRVWSW